MKTKTSNPFSALPVLQGGASLSPIYWWGDVLIVVAGVVAAMLLPYKRYSLDFGNYGTAPLVVARFSGAQVVRLDRGWHSLSGNLLPSEVSKQISLETGEIQTPEGTKLRFIVKNPTGWSIQELIIGRFAQPGPPSGGDSAKIPVLSLIECSVRPYSANEVPASFSSEASRPQLLAVVGHEQ